MTTVYKKEEIDKAMNMSIITVVESLGFPLKKTGKAYSFGENHKLRVYPDTNSYYDFSTGTGGNPINFVQRQMETTFPRAMKYLLTGDFEEADHVEQPKEDFHYYFPRNSDTRVGKDYLINQRKLDATLVDFLFEKDRIRMDKLNQIIFPWQKNGLIVGATVQGTTYDPEKYDRDYFKGIAANSESNFSYNISIGHPDKLYVFESPIDMLSYWSMHKEIRNATFAATNGAKEEAVHNTRFYLKENHCDIKDIYVCSDNDRVGQVFYQKLDLGYANFNVHKEIPDDLMIPEEVYNIYQTVLQEKESQLPVEVLAALHKTETNLSMTNECTSKEELVFYFGKKINRSKEKPTPYTSEELTDRVTKMVEDVERFTIDGHTDIAKLLTTRLKETESENQLSESYLQRVEGYLEQYQADELLIGVPVKDWNEKRQNEEAAISVQSKEAAKNQQSAPKERTRSANKEASLREEKSPSAPQATIGSESRNISSDGAVQKYYTNQERRQAIQVTGSIEEVHADIFQTGQYAGSLEPSSLEEMEKLIHSYGFMAIDKEDYAKYSKEQTQQQEAVEYSMEQ